MIAITFLGVIIGGPAFRIREAVLTDAGKAWLANVDSQIAALRAQLQ